MQYRFFIFFIWVNGFSIGSVFGSDDFQNRRNAGDQRQYFLDFLSLFNELRWFWRLQEQSQTNRKYKSINNDAGHEGRRAISLDLKVVFGEHM